MAETVSPRISMFPCAANPGPFTPPNQSVQSLPEKVALPPRASTMPSWRTSRPGSSRMTRSNAASAVLPSAMSRNPSIARYRLGHDWVATAPTPAQAAVRPRRVEDLRDGVAAVADEVEVNEVDRGPWDQEVQQERQEVAVAAQEVLRQE